jgi:hypothetical protein
MSLTVSVAALAASVPAQGAVTFGQLDDFQNGSTMGWDKGDASTTPPTNVAAGGPRGEGDRFLQNVSEGFGPGSRQVILNKTQWAGDYNVAGVTRVDASLANFGTTPLFMRLALLTNASAYGTVNVDAVEIPPDGVWRRVSFDLTSDALGKIQGTESLAQVLSHVVTLRILSAQAGPTQRGDVMESTIGVDDLRALRLPGDANFDGRVDSADFRIARFNLGAAGPHAWAQGDFDFDGRVTGLDVLLLRRNFEQSIPPQGAVGAASVSVLPEPTGVSLLMLCSTLALRRRRART